MVFTPVASADCPDIEVVFARGTDDTGGLGAVGGSFVNALSGKVGGRSVGSYAVNYPASYNFLLAGDGANDASAHVQYMMGACPNTRLVLGGYSQGAAVMGFVTANAVPGGVDPADVPQPMPVGVANHVAAVALFGKPDPEFMKAIDSPPVNVGPLYAAKTIELCAPGDPICSDGGDGAAHTSYTKIGMVDQAATYVAGRV